VSYAVMVDDAAVSMVAYKQDAEALILDTAARLLARDWAIVLMLNDPYRVRMRSTGGAHVLLSMMPMNWVKAKCPKCKRVRHVAIWGDELQCLVCHTTGWPWHFGLDEYVEHDPAPVGFNYTGGVTG